MVSGGKGWIVSKYWIIIKKNNNLWYKIHPKGNGFIKEDETGRFHIKREKFNVFDLHYDINVEWRHLSIPMPERCGNEKRRLRKLSYQLFPNEFKVKIKKEKVPETYADVLRKQTPQVKRVRGVPTPLILIN